MLTSEDRIQSDSFLWFHNNYPALRGLTPGVPDLLLIKPGGNGQMAGIEFKTETGALSPIQRILHGKWSDYGVTVHVVRSVEAFKEIIINYCGEPQSSTY